MAENICTHSLCMCMQGAPAESRIYLAIATPRLFYYCSQMWTAHYLLPGVTCIFTFPTSESYQYKQQGALLYRLFAYKKELHNSDSQSNLVFYGMGNKSFWSAIVICVHTTLALESSGRHRIVKVKLYSIVEVTMLIFLVVAILTPKGDGKPHLFFNFYHSKKVEQSQETEYGEKYGSSSKPFILFSKDVKRQSSS